LIQPKEAVAVALTGGFACGAKDGVSLKAFSGAEGWGAAFMPKISSGSVRPAM
jgi:hypothetical protein